MTSRILYLNAAFDLELSGPAPARYSEQLAEMTLWFLPVAGPGDRIVLGIPAPADYLECLHGLGLSPAVPLASGETCAGPDAFPWGWNAQAVERFRSHGVGSTCPDLEAVRRVNSRLFSAQLAQSLGVAVPGGRLCRSAEQAAEALGDESAWPLAAKPDHGNTGIGFVFVHRADDLAGATKRVRALFPRPDAHVCVEPWLTRTMDLSVRFELAQDGAVRDLRLSRALVTPGGVSYGIVHVPGDPPVAPHRDALERTAAAVAKALSAEGYWGPVNIDAMVAAQDGRERLFPLLEINARQSMSFIAYEVQRRLAPGKPCLLRTLARARHDLPGSYPDLRSALGDAAFGPATATGVALLTPLRLERAGRTQQPERSILFVAGRTVDELERFDRRATAVLAPAC
jgi:hypothetical protein